MWFTYSKKSNKLNMRVIPFDDGSVLDECRFVATGECNLILYSTYLCIHPVLGPSQSYRISLQIPPPDCQTF